MATAKRTARPLGVILHRGVSPFDGAPYVVIMPLGKSSNKKTGSMLQTYIIRSDVHPVVAVRNEMDGSRGSLSGIGGSWPSSQLPDLQAVRRGRCPQDRSGHVRCVHPRAWWQGDHDCHRQPAHPSGLRCDMRILSRPGQNDGLIRYWLSRQGWRAPTHVRDGVIWVPDAKRADYLTTLLNRHWDEEPPQPRVGIYSCTPEEDGDDE